MAELRELTRCRRGCGADVLLVITDKNEKLIPVDPAPVPPDTPRAYIVMGHRAFGSVAALVDHLVSRGADALNPADYPRHVHHYATCRNRP